MANVTITTKQVASDGIPELREAYLRQLREAQEPLLETLVPASAAHLINTRDGLVGYGLIHPEKGLFEYHLEAQQWAYGTEIFGKFIRRVGVTQALVKTFDDVFMASALDHQTSVTTVGMLVRHYIPRQLPNVASVGYRHRLATPADLPAIFAVEQDVFTNRERMLMAVERNWVWLYLAPGSAKLIGFGLIKPLRPGSEEVDVGIAIAREFRNKGYALYILQDLMTRSIAAGQRPIAGVAMDNRASRRMGQRIGMSPIHRLVRMTFPREPPAESSV